MDQIIAHGYVAVAIADEEPPITATVDAQRGPAARAAHPDQISGLGVRFPRGAPNALVRRAFYNMTAESRAFFTPVLHCDLKEC